MEMDRNFVKELSKFGMLILSMALLVLVGFGILLLKFPQLVLMALSYVVGAGMLLLGLAVAGSILYALLAARKAS